MAIAGASLLQLAGDPLIPRFDFPARGFSDDLLSLLGTPRRYYKALVTIHASELILKRFELPPTLDGLLSYRSGKRMTAEDLQRYRVFARSYLVRHGAPRQARTADQLPPPDENVAIRKIVDDNHRVLRALAKKYRDPKASRAEYGLDQGLVDAQSALFSAVLAYLENDPPLSKIVDDAFGKGFRSFLKQVAEHKVVDGVRKDTPELTKDFKAELERAKPKTKLDRLDVLERVKDEFYSVDMGKDRTGKSRFESLDAAIEDGEGNTYDRGETLEDEMHFDSNGSRVNDYTMERRGMLKEAIAEADLTERERLVAELKLIEMVNDEDVAAALKKRFGKAFSGANIRQLTSRATLKVSAIARSKLTTD